MPADSTDILSAASGIFHDMKMPLQLQINYVRIIEAKLHNLAPDVYPHISNEIGWIIDANCKMRRMIDNLLDILRSECKSLKVLRTKCDVAACIRTICSHSESYAAQCGINLSFECAEDELYASVDVMKLERMVLNLISNAMKYTPKGGAILVRVKAQDDTFSISVSDTGSGIAPDRLECIFERFHTSEQESLRGTGLGLPLVREMARLHGGDVAVESELGTGSTFTITLPLSLEDALNLPLPLNPISERVRVELA